MLWSAPQVLGSALAFLALLLAPMRSVAEEGGEEKSWTIKGILKPSGGRYFTERLELKVPIFRQKDDRWRNEPLGSSRLTMGAKGCAVAAAAMVLASYGFDIDPPRLNRFLHRSRGYTQNRGVHWETAAQYDPGKLRKAYEGPPSYALIDASLKRGNPVIARVTTQQGPHFVVIAGKDGFDYLTVDPGTGSSLGLYPLSMFRTTIETLRVYERL